MFDEEGNEETVEVARENDRVKKDGAKNSHKVIEKLARNSGDNIKTLATVHLSELLKVSGNETNNVEHSHQWMDENGWTIRHSYIVDKQGKIYDTTMNIANGRDRRIIYAISNVREIDKAKGTAHGDVPSTENGRGSHIKSSSYDGTIAQQKPHVKQKFSFDDEDYLLAVRAGDMDAAQEMVDEAAQRTGSPKIAVGILREREQRDIRTEFVI